MSSDPEVGGNSIVVIKSPHSSLLFLLSFIQGFEGFSDVCVPALAGDLVDNSRQLVLGDWCLHLC